MPLIDPPPDITDQVPPTGEPDNVFVSLSVIVALGVLLTDYAQKNGIDAHKDPLFPIIATKGTLGLATTIFFLLSTKRQ